MPVPDRPRPTFKFIGGELCLDFVNTIANYRDPARRYDKLTSYADLLAWAERSGALTVTVVQHLAATSQRQRDAAGTVLAEACRLRAALYGIAVATAHHDSPDQHDLATLNGFVGPTLAHSRLETIDDGFHLVLAPDAAALDGPLWPVVRSAIDLFTTGDLDRLRECAGDPCGWLFLDTSRGGQRRWCDMADCGNLTKVRRFRARHTGSTG